MTDDDVVTWLLDSDPALRWQVERDLVGAPEDTWRATRKRVATEGFGATLLAKQDPDGQWAGGAYFPSDTTEADFADDGQPWTATTEVIRSKRRDDGTWARDYVLPGRVWFDVDTPAGEPSKWITLSALRVLRWWATRAA
ncbi:hypothetical protein GCM10028820_27550 [Tessaracoccus terricola]